MKLPTRVSRRSKISWPGPSSASDSRPVERQRQETGVAELASSQIPHLGDDARFQEERAWRRPIRPSPTEAAVRGRVSVDEWRDQASSGRPGVGCRGLRGVVAGQVGRVLANVESPFAVQQASPG